MLHQAALVAPRQRVALDELLGQADHADLETLPRTTWSPSRVSPRRFRRRCRSRPPCWRRRRPRSTRARWMSRASSVPEMTRIRIPGPARHLGDEIRHRCLLPASRWSPPPQSHPLCGIPRGAGTWPASGARRPSAVGVRLRPSSPPAPRRTISFSLSITSNDRSGRTWTTIMWIELVPMSMAAMRIQAGEARQGRLLQVTRRILLATHKSPAQT